MIDEKKKYISQIVTQSEVDKWESRQIVTISAPTKAGKTTFISKVLAKTEKSILFLVSRSALKQSIYNDVKDIQNIELKTYQSVASKIYNQMKLEAGIEIEDFEPIDFDFYDYIVCDECHYFTSDSAFNDYTDLLLDKLTQTDAKLIMMSATMQEVIELIDNFAFMSDRSIQSYEIERNLNGIIDSIEFYDYDDYIMDTLQEIDTKAIVFINNRERLKGIQKTFENSLLLVSEQAEERSEEEQKLYDSMLRDKKFKSQFLFATSCIDVGINIFDSEVKDIIIESTDITNIVQSIGRKRQINTDDKYTLHFKLFQPAQINAKIQNLKRKLEHAEYYLGHGQDKYILKYFGSNDPAKILTFGIGKEKIYFNSAKYEKIRYDIAELEKIAEVGIEQYLIDSLNLNRDNVNINYHFKQIEKFDSLNNFLKAEYTESQIFDLSRKEKLKNFLQENFREAPKQLTTINKFFSKNNIDFILESYDNRTNKGSQSAWKLVKKVC